MNETDVALLALANPQTNPCAMSIKGKALYMYSTYIITQTNNPLTDLLKPNMICPK